MVVAAFSRHREEAASKAIALSRWRRRARPPLAPDTQQPGGARGEGAGEAIARIPRAISPEPTARGPGEHDAGPEVASTETVALADRGRSGRRRDARGFPGRERPDSRVGVSSASVCEHVAPL